MTEKPDLDPLGLAYARLAFGIEAHVPGFIDAYLGNEADRTRVLPAEPPTPAALAADASALLAMIPELDASEARKAYLTKQVVAMQATVRRLAGEELPYLEDVNLLFDISPSLAPEAEFETAIAKLDELLPGSGAVGPRMTAWRDQYVISPEVARRVVDTILPELRTRTAQLVALPEGEAIEIVMVNDKPWSGYNWYLGDARSRVDLNTDLPIRAIRLTDLLAHECYPGHHTEHLLKERLYTVDGFGEHALQLINTPECLISEGIATMAEEMIFSGAELADFRRSRVYPAAGISGDPEREIAIGAAIRGLASVASNAALLLHHEGRDAEEVVTYLQQYGLSTEAEARQRLRFIADPLWRTYIFTYDVGRKLVSAWLDAAPAVERRARFATLLTEQVTPSQLAVGI